MTRKSNLGHLRSRPIVIGHRGAAGYRLENTLASFAHAIDLGVDYVELDVVCAGDGALVARHDNALAVLDGDSVVSGTTDVADRPEFEDRKTMKTVDGASVLGWFTEDFSLPELKALCCREQYPQLRPENMVFDGQESIPTLQEVLALIRHKNKAAGRTVGIFVETKYPDYFNGIGLPIEEPLLDQLGEFGAEDGELPVIIESFDAGHLKKLSDATSVPLVQLIGSSEEPNLRDTLSPRKLEEIAAYAVGISVEKECLLPRGSDMDLLDPSAAVRDSHAAGLAVYVWTFRNENYFLPQSLRRGDAESDPYYLRRHGDAEEELRTFLDLGVDGVFSDHPDTAVWAIAE